MGACIRLMSRLIDVVFPKPIHTARTHRARFPGMIIKGWKIYIYIRRIFRGSLEYRKERHFVIYTQYPVAALNHYEWISRSFGMSTCWTHARYVFSHDRLSFWTIAQDQVPLRIFPALGNICSVWWDRFTPISPVLCNETFVTSLSFLIRNQSRSVDRIDASFFDAQDDKIW